MPTTLEIVRLNPAVSAVDVRPLMPHDWQQQIRDVAEESGTPVILRGGEVATSRAPSDFITDYKVVTGDKILPRLPWLARNYRGAFLELVQQFAGHELDPDPDEQYSPNINVLIRGRKYEPHVDANEITGMLAVYDIHKGDGGVLTHRLPDSTTLWETRVKAGWLYIFNGRDHIHGVSELNTDIRITVPMNYNPKGVPIVRPSNLGAIHGIQVDK